MQLEVQRNHNEIKSIKRNGYTKRQTHSLIKKEMEDGKVIIIRRFYGGNIKQYLTWCSEKPNMRTQKAFDYLKDKNEYDLNCDEVSNGNTKSKDQNRKNFWDKAASVLIDAIPVELHRNIKLGGETCDPTLFEGEELNMDIKLIFEDRKDAMWVHDLYRSQLGDKKVDSKPPIIYEGRGKENRDDGETTGKDIENRKWFKACKLANEQVLETLKNTPDLENIEEWIKNDKEICQKLPKIPHMREEDRQKGLNKINGDFPIHTTEAPQEDLMEDPTDEQMRDYSLLCRNSVLHAIRLAVRLETKPDLKNGGNYTNEVIKSAETVMNAFKATDNINAIKTFLGITKPATATNEE